MSHFAANSWARPRSRAATATTSTSELSRAGFSSAFGVMRAAPSVPIRRVATGRPYLRRLGVGRAGLGVAGDVTAAAEDREHADEEPQREHREHDRLAGRDPELGPVEGLAVDELA